MYVTRHLSLYKNSPESLYIPPEGTNSGFLVLQDEETEVATCFGSRKSHVIKELPLPQNKDLSVRHTKCFGVGAAHVFEEAIFIPVLDQPLSSHLYYVIHQDGKHKGNAYTCSKEEDKRRNCCLIKCVKDKKPTPLDPNNIYQQIEISHRQGIHTTGFKAKSAAPDGFPPQVLKNKGWDIKSKYPKSFRVGEALGLNVPLRTRLPNFDKVFEHVTVGKWVCPFIFVKEGKVRDQIDKSLFYEITLEQRWEKIFESRDNINKNTVLVDVEIQSENMLVDGVEATWDSKGDIGGVVWFNGGIIGLNLAVLERMKWEQERGGWKGSKGNVLKVNRVEEFLGFGDWNKFGCYVLVERFVLKRMDGSLVLSYDFKHTHHIRTKWE